MSNNAEYLHREVNFEEYIVKKLGEQGTWVISENDDGFDPTTALYAEDFLQFVTKTSPDKVEKLKKNNGDKWSDVLIRALVKSLDAKGTLGTLRNGIQMAGYQTIECSGHYPDDPRLPRIKELYDNNILRVMRQVHYQTAGNKSLDLVFFLNGIPVATSEVKTDLTQSVEDAIKEYQTERKPVEPGTNRKNYLLMYKRGAVVHFAISESEIWMCTDLTKDKPRFLPFNKGNNGHAGNPPMEKDDTDYPTGYFWNDICKKENWTKIFHNYVFEEKEKKEDLTGKMYDDIKQMFPRFHQWDVVTKCLEDIDENGVGMRYLIEHSPGSGKTETITWLAHELIRIRDDKGNKTFSSVIVVTDRVGLDTNIKGTIKQLRKMDSLIEMIGGDADKRTYTAKNKQLSDALHNKKEIIVVTLQTFPYALEAIADDPELVNANFAVLIDEAHSAQGGETSDKMNAALSYAASKNKGKRKGVTGEEADPTDEDAINAYFTQLQDAKKLPENVSFFAFTATPKPETVTLFGRPGDETDENGAPKPVSFHLYPMRQAIEEEYILDVLKGYMPYQTAYKIKEDITGDKYVDEKKAIRTIARWEQHHPTNVMSKAEFIVEHFVKNVAQLLNGQAKAMVVTSSRAAVIRYKYAIEAYLKAHPEYDRDKVEDRLRFTVPGEPLVAFSSSVRGEMAVMAEDATIVDEFEYLKENPFAQIKRDYDYTEQNMNNLGHKTIEKAFDEPESRILIVANKFQTGFNQPKLCAMYIDKVIANDIEIVQTYSRVNRTFNGKDRIFIVDFVNEPKIVRNAFKKYDTGAVMESAQNLDIIYDLKKMLDDADIYSESDIEAYKVVKYKSMTDINASRTDSYRKKIYDTVLEPANRWNHMIQAQRQAYNTWLGVKNKAEKDGDKDAIKDADAHLEAISENIEKLSEFKSKLKKFSSAYEYISQIVDLGEPDMEVFNGFAKLLMHRLDGKPADEVDISSLVLSDYRLTKITDETEPVKDNSTLKPMSSNTRGTGEKKESLKKIISRMNEIWGDDEGMPTTTKARAVNAIADYVATDDVTRIQIKNSSNSKDAIIANGRLVNIIKLAALSLKNNDFADLAEKIISDPQSIQPIASLIYDLIMADKRLDMPDIAEYVKSSTDSNEEGK